MTFRRSFTLLLACVLLGGSMLVMAQGRWRGRGRRGTWSPGDRRGVPTWEVDQEHRGDLFTFARIRYQSRGGWGGQWATDHPDSDLNFSLRLHQLTSLKVNPDPVQLNLTDDELFDYPFIYIIEPGHLYFSEPEVRALKKYCLNGGFLMVDDFWGEDQYRNLAEQLERVFPERPPQEVPLEHEIFHNVYDLKEKPQIPAIGQARRLHNGEIETWERSWNGDTRTPHYRAIYDDSGRIMVFICHNTDLGDGWEREGEDPWYFEEFSVKKAYPLGINIVTYAMTH